MKLVSVLVPMYNTEKYIERCIKSIINQTYKNLDIVLLDDGSIDNTYSIAAKYAELDSRIRLLSKENEKNVSKTRNYLLDNILGDYFVFIDSDDYIEPQYVEELLNTVIATDADCAMCDYSLQIKKLPVINPIKKKTEVYNQYEALSKIVIENCPSAFMLWNKIYKTSVLGDLRFNYECRYGEDFYFVVHFFAKCNNVAFFNNKLYHYIVRPGSEMRSGFGKKHIDFVRALDESVDTEEDLKVKHILQCWSAFSAIGFLVEGKFKKYDNEDDFNYLKEVALKYESIFLDDDKVNPIYKKFFNIVKTLEFKDDFFNGLD